ncbi:MAG: ABC transporter substrate-binding protein [Francisella sp.]
MRKVLIFLSLLILSISCTWAIENPVDMLNGTMVKTQEEFVKNADEYEKDPYKLLSVVDSDIVPLIAAHEVAQLVVGSSKWKQATPEEQKKFINSAGEMLAFMYMKNIAGAGKFKITLFPFNKDDTNWQNKTIVVVNGKITNIDSNKSSDFAVKMFQKDGKWHIYDFDIAGVSILKTYQQQFAPYKNVADMIKAAEKLTNDIKKKSYPKLLNKEYNFHNIS